MLAEHPAAGGHDRHRAHPVGHPRRPDRPQRPPAPLRRRLRRGDPQRDHRELRRAARRARAQPASSSVSETDTEVAAHLLAAAYADAPGGRRAAWPRPCARSAAGSRARSPSSPRSVARARHPGRRPPQQPAGGRRRRRRVLPRLRRRRVHRPHPQRARARPGPGRRDRPDPRGDRHRLRRCGRSSRRPTPSTGTPPPPRRAATTGSCSRRSPSSPRPSPTPCSAGSATHGELILDEVRLSDQELRDIDKIFVVSCGTSYHAGLIAKYAIEHWTRIPVEVELASEFRYRDPVLDRSTLVIVISQSGETMDTLMALRHAKEQRARVLAICNANGSTIPRESDAVLYTHAGPGGRGRLDQGLPHPGRRLLPGRAVPRPGARHQVRGRDRRDRRRPAPAARGGGRGARGHGAGPRARPVAAPTPTRSSSSAATSGIPVALEGALKLKELAYIHAEGFAAGELKHGPDRGDRRGHPGDRRSCPSPRSRESVHGKVVSNIQEVRARGARTIVIAEEGDDEVAALRRPRHPGAAHADAARPGRHDRAAAGAGLRDRRHPRSATSTSPATWRSPSPSSDGAVSIAASASERGAERGRNRHMSAVE